MKTRQKPEQCQDPRELAVLERTRRPARLPAGERRRRGTVVCDVDGTLAPRNRVLSRRVAEALAAVAAAGWRLVILSGQPFQNLEGRIVRPLRRSLRSVRNGLEHLRLLTCEGGHEWRLDETGCRFAPDGGIREGHYSKSAREELTRLVQDALPRLLPRGVGILAGPDWFESAICVVKISATVPQRHLLARRLARTLRRQDVRNFRIGLGGTFSIGIKHRLTHKGTALSRLVRGLPPGQRALYLADEFDAFGNDREALRVRGLVCVDFSGRPPGAARGAVSGGGRGPQAVAAWLRCLAQSSGDGALEVDEVIRRAVQCRQRGRRREAVPLAHAARLPFPPSSARPG